MNLHKKFIPSLSKEGGRSPRKRECSLEGRLERGWRGRRWRLGASCREGKKGGGVENVRRIGRGDIREGKGGRRCAVLRG